MVLSIMASMMADILLEGKLFVHDRHDFFSSAHSVSEQYLAFVTAKYVHDTTLISSVKFLLSSIFPSLRKQPMFRKVAT